MNSKLAQFLLLGIGLILAPLYSDEPPSSTPAPVSSPGEQFDKTTYQYPAGYNAPAAVDLDQAWSGFCDASFIYWYAREEGLYLAESALLLQGNVVMAPEGESLGQSFEYQPGFKIGLGAIYKHEWIVRAGYTWFRNRTSVSKAAPTNTSDVFQGLGVWNVDDWFQQTIAFQEVNSLQGQALSGTEIASHWHLGMDLVDLDLSRPYYQGSSLTVFPFIGLRAAWIRQNIKVALTQAPASEGGSSFLLSQPIFSHNRSNCWGIGPRMGASAKCLLPMGWRLEGSGSGSLLATTFTKLFHAEDAQSIAVAPGPYEEVQNGHHSLLPNAEMSLGIGWETYGCSHQYHFDFAASYDFNLFWGQNRIREMLDDFWAGTDADAGDLFFHGLTLSGRFDF